MDKWGEYGIIYTDFLPTCFLLSRLSPMEKRGSIGSEGGEAPAAEAGRWTCEKTRANALAAFCTPLRRAEKQHAARLPVRR